LGGIGCIAYIHLTMIHLQFPLRNDLGAEGVNSPSDDDSVMV